MNLGRFDKEKQLQWFDKSGIESLIVRATKSIAQAEKFL